VADAQVHPPTAAAASQSAPSRAAPRPFYEWLCRKCGTTDLVHVDPLSIFPGMRQAPPRSRTAIRVVDMCFEGCPAGFQWAVDNGFPVRLTIGDALGATRTPDGKWDYACKALEGLRPHAQRGLDSKQGVSPKDYDLERVLINSVSLASPHNTMTQSVGIMTSTLPGVYAALKRQQTEDLAADLGMPIDNPNILAHIPVSEKPDVRPVPILKVSRVAACMCLDLICACLPSPGN